MRPETCAPTCTVVTADNAPVAETRETTSPVSTTAVSSLGGVGVWCVAA